MVTSEQRLSEGLWTTVRVLPESGEVHVAHGPAFECFVTLGRCDCCTCADCQEVRAWEESPEGREMFAWVIDELVGEDE